MKQEHLIFLMSQPRSGSTLTQRILGKHSKIYTRSEPWLMLYPAYSLKDEGLYTEYDFLTERKAFNNFIQELPEGQKTYIHELRKMYLNLYSFFIDETDNKYFLDKTPRYYLILDKLLQIYPKAKFIVLIRNPLAVLGSIINTWTRDNWFNLAKYRFDLTSAIETSIDVIENKQEKCLIVHYEELLSENKKTLKKLFRHLNLDFEEDVLKYYQQDDKKWTYGDQVNVYNKEGIDKSNNTNWQKNLNKPQYWRVMNDYLQYIGKEKFEKLGYNFNEYLDLLQNSMPAETLDEIYFRTFPLSSFLDDTRDCLIQNQSKQKLLDNKVRECKHKQQVIDEKNVIIKKQEDELEKLMKIINEIEKNKNNIGLKNNLFRGIKYPYLKFIQLLKVNDEWKHK